MSDQVLVIDMQEGRGTACVICGEWCGVRQGLVTYEDMLVPDGCTDDRAGGGMACCTLCYWLFRAGRSGGIKLERPLVPDWSTFAEARAILHVFLLSLSSEVCGG